MHLGSMSLVLIVLMGIKTFHFVILKTPKWYISIASWLKTHETWSHCKGRGHGFIVCTIHYSYIFSYQPLKRLLILDRGGITKSLFPYILGIVLFGKRKNQKHLQVAILSFEVTHMTIIFNFKVFIFNVHMGFSVSTLTMIIKSNTSGGWAYGVNIKKIIWTI
jgi:hypothetical protein